jgi:hypothetical protein
MGAWGGGGSIIVLLAEGIHYPVGGLSDVRPVGGVAVGDPFRSLEDLGALWVAEALLKGVPPGDA